MAWTKQPKTMDEKPIKLRKGGKHLVVECLIDNHRSFHKGELLKVCGVVRRGLTKFQEVAAIRPGTPSKQQVGVLHKGDYKPVGRSD